MKVRVRPYTDADADARGIPILNQSPKQILNQSQSQSQSPCLNLILNRK